MNIFGKFNSLLSWFTEKFHWLPGLSTRICMGGLFTQTGWGKLHHLPKVIDFFTSLGIPYPEIQAPFVAGLEFVCGILMLAGLLTRWAAAPMVVTMTVAILTAKRGDFSTFNDLMGVAEFLYILLLGWLIFMGAGSLSLDRLFGIGQARGKKR